MHFKEEHDYELDQGTVRLPWGESQPATLAIPLRALAEEKAKRDAGRVPTKVVDPVCGMMFDPDDAASTSDYRGTVYYFCAIACKAQFDASPRKFLPSRSLSRWVRPS
jgi:YHS domain-containing protein